MESLEPPLVYGTPSNQAWRDTNSEVHPDVIKRIRAATLKSCKHPCVRSVLGSLSWNRDSLVRELETKRVMATLGTTPYHRF